MIIQFNTDHNINGHEAFRAPLIATISDGLRHFSSHITRVEVHLTDEDGNKNGINDKRCLIEARIEGKAPIAVADNGDTAQLAVTGAVDKLKNALKTILAR